jgi:hypothetical protein
MSDGLGSYGIRRTRAPLHPIRVTHHATVAGDFAMTPSNPAASNAEFSTLKDDAHTNAFQNVFSFYFVVAFIARQNVAAR